MKHKEYQQKRAALDDAYLFGEITLSDYARESQNLDTKYHQIKNDNKIYKQYKEINSPSRNGLREVSFVPIKKHSRVKRSGKLIKCPKCYSIKTIYHLSWISLYCQTCKSNINKYDWQIEKGVYEK